MHKLNNIQLAYIGLEPKSSHTNKYSPPLKLVLFHIIAPCIKWFKCFYYPPLLNNYLINYLISSGLTYGGNEYFGGYGDGRICTSLYLVEKVRDTWYTPFSWIRSWVNFLILH